jgi:hypothetical protein
MKKGQPSSLDVSDANATTSDVISPKTFYAGVDPEIKIGTITEATDLSSVDPDLVSGNIKNGITIFGIVGSVDVRDISDADAATGDVRESKTFYAVGGARRTGALVERSLSPANEDVLAGIYDATTLSAVDGDLVTGNIKYGVAIFGIEGHPNVRDISDADAVVGEVFLGKTFYAVGGAKKTGTYEAVPDFRPYAPDLTVPIFKTNPGAGTFTSPDKVNDGLTAAQCYGDEGKYVDIELPGAYKIKQWRQHGYDTGVGDGKFKIQIWNVDEAQWEDWTAEFLALVTLDWSEWAEEDEVITSKIRLIVTVTDSTTNTRLTELEVKY